MVQRSTRLTKLCETLTKTPDYPYKKLKWFYPRINLEHRRKIREIKYKNKHKVIWLNRKITGQYKIPRLSRSNSMICSRKKFTSGKKIIKWITNKKRIHEMKKIIHKRKKMDEKIRHKYKESFSVLLSKYLCVFFFFSFYFLFSFLWIN